MSAPASSSVSSPSAGRLGRERLSERGSAALELPMVVGWLLVPFGLLVLVLPTWVERELVARDLAAELARAVVVSGDVGVVDEMVPVLAQGHGLQPSDLRVTAPVTVVPGEGVRVEVAVRLPVVSLPLFGPVGGGEVRGAHAERFPDYGAVDQ